MQASLTWSRRWCVSALLILSGLAGLTVTPAKAQQATAAINGVVRDPSGAAIPGARVELTNVGTSVGRTTTTNGDGAYAFPSVVPGVYSMQVSSTGFSNVSQPPTTLEV